MLRLLTAIFAIILMAMTTMFAPGSSAERNVTASIDTFNDNDMVIEGMLTDVKINSVTVTPKEGKRMKLDVNRDTVIKRKGVHIPVTDLKVDEIVRATYRLDEGTKVALTITVVGK